LCRGGVNRGLDDAIISQTTPMLIDPFLYPPKLLEVNHVAHRLSFSQEWVRRLIRDKKLPAIRIGGRWRVEPAALQRFIDEQQAQIARDERRIDQLLHTAGGRLDDLQVRRHQHTDGASAKAAG
jgi:excisionase family DNA binding protein